jgi:hypothetical protein
MANTTARKSLALDDETIYVDAAYYVKKQRNRD